MRNILLALFFIVLTPDAFFAQQIEVSDHNSHELFVEQLNSSKEFKYNDIVEKYDDYIKSHPDSINAQISKCRFIGAAYYDDYEDYDPNWELTDACIEKLYLAYPKNPDVIVYKLEGLYGSEELDFINEAIDIYDINNEHWTKLSASLLFEAAAYATQETDEYNSLIYANKAEGFNEDLDLSLLISEIHIANGETEKAKKALESKLCHDDEPWVLNQKGGLLIKLNEFDKALEVYERVRYLDSSMVDNESLYKISINGGNTEIARSYLIQDTIGDWNKTESLQQLLKHDMAYSSAEITLASYTRMQEESYYDDFFGIKQLRMLIKNPFNSFSIIGFSHFLVLLLFLIILFLIPYLWVLPVFSIGKYFNLKFDSSGFWNLKHFWLISFAYLLVQAILVFTFYYQDYMNYLFDLAGNYYDGEEDQIATPNEILFFSSLLLISTLAFLNKGRLKYVFRSTWSIAKIISMSFGFLILNMILLRVLGNFVDLTEASSYFSILNMKQELTLMINEKGFFFTAMIAAIFAPFYEEIIFRGVILNSTQKHIGFVPANILQSILFGLIHFNLALFPFYFVFWVHNGARY